MEIRNELSAGRHVSPANRGEERRSREGEWQPASPPREAPVAESPEPALSARDALRGRWVTDARRDEPRTSLDAAERHRQVRRRLEAAYGPAAPVANPAPSPNRGAVYDPIDFVV